MIVQQHFISSCPLSTVSQSISVTPSLKNSYLWDFQVLLTKIYPKYTERGKVHVPEHRRSLLLILMLLSMLSSERRIVFILSYISYTLVFIMACKSWWLCGCCELEPVVLVSCDLVSWSMSHELVSWWHGWWSFTDIVEAWIEFDWLLSISVRSNADAVNKPKKHRISHQRHCGNSLIYFVIGIYICFLTESANELSIRAPEDNSSPINQA